MDRIELLLEHFRKTGCEWDWKSIEIELDYIEWLASFGSTDEEEI